MPALPPNRAPAGTQMARWSAKLLLTSAAVALVGGAIWYARAATVPLIVAALVSTQLLPLIDWAVRRNVPRGLAVAGCMIGVLLVSVALAWVFSAALFGQLGGAGNAIGKGADQVVTWLKSHDDWVKQHESDVRKFLADVLPAAKHAARGLASGLLGGLSLVAQLVSSALLTFVFLLYLLTDGSAVWRWIQDRFGDDRRAEVAAGGSAAWSAATGYIRGIALVALIDTTVIGAGMLIIGTPLAGTLMLLSFVSLFIPILGAWVSGVVIFLVTLGDQGTASAIAIGIVILVAQQLDSMFVTPLVYKQAVNLHPIVTLTAVIVGTQLLGIVGAFLAVPMVAVGWSVYNALEQPRAGTPSPSPVWDDDAQAVP